MTMVFALSHGLETWCASTHHADRTIFLFHVLLWHMVKFFIFVLCLFEKVAESQSCHWDFWCTSCPTSAYCWQWTKWIVCVSSSCCIALLWQPWAPWRTLLTFSLDAWYLTNRIVALAWIILDNLMQTFKIGKSMSYLLVGRHGTAVAITCTTSYSLYGMFTIKDITMSFILVYLATHSPSL